MTERGDIGAYDIRVEEGESLIKLKACGSPIQEVDERAVILTGLALEREMFFLLA